MRVSRLCTKVPFQSLVITNPLLHTVGLKYLSLLKSVYEITSIGSIIGALFSIFSLRKFQRHLDSKPLSESLSNDFYTSCNVSSRCSNLLAVPQIPSSSRIFYSVSLSRSLIVQTIRLDVKKGARPRRSKHVARIVLTRAIMNTSSQRERERERDFHFAAVLGRVLVQEREEDCAPHAQTRNSSAGKEEKRGEPRRKRSPKKASTRERFRLPFSPPPSPSFFFLAF